MKRVTVGAMRERLLVQEQTATPDGYGGEVVSWETLGECWAHVRPATAREAYLRGKTSHTEDVVITIRAAQTFALDERTVDRLRIVHRDRTFKISTLSRLDYRLDYYELQCTMWGATEQSEAP